jgi:anaerobic selenocysteine-containing dehydrogenase
MRTGLPFASTNFTWDNPLSHGMMHMVISSARRRPYKIDAWPHVYSEYVVGLSDGTTGVMEMLTKMKRPTGEYVIPRIIYSDLILGNGRLRRPDLPDTTYLERHDCIAFGPAYQADGVTAIRWPVIEPDRNITRVQSVQCELGAPRLAGFRERRRIAEMRRLRRLRNHIRRPELARLQAFGRNG